MTAEPAAVEPFTRRVPAVIVVAPVKVLLPLSVSVPAPDFVSVAAAPLITPEIVLAVPVLLTVTPVVVAMAPAVTFVAVTLRLDKGTVPPTAAPNVVVPLEITARLWGGIEEKLALKARSLAGLMFQGCTVHPVPLSGPLFKKTNSPPL